MDKWLRHWTRQQEVWGLIPAALVMNKSPGQALNTPSSNGYQGVISLKLLRGKLATKTGILCTEKGAPKSLAKWHPSLYSVNGRKCVLQSPQVGKTERMSSNTWG